MKAYGVACSATYECKNSAGLICPSLPNQCNCPINMSSIFCDCQSGYYYDYIKSNCSEF